MIVVTVRTLLQGWERGYSSPEARWARLGPYYAMFPISFVQEAIDTFTRPGDVVADPFCGRGTAPYVAMINGRGAVAGDVNPVAWLYTMTKLFPARDSKKVKERIVELKDEVTREDRQAENEFQKLAFCEDVLGFLNVARSRLKWRDDIVDRTTAAFIVHYLHSKIPQGLSNQLRHSRAMAPNYCIKWWRDNGYGTPPHVDPVGFLKQRIDWRYSRGIPGAAHSSHVSVWLGDSSRNVPSMDSRLSLVITSPPYSNVTDYKADNWLRLWALNEGPSVPSWTTEQKYGNLSKYEKLIQKVFTSIDEQADASTIWLIRCDARDRTQNVVYSALEERRGDRAIRIRPAPYTRSTQTALYGDNEPKPGEIDLLLVPERISVSGRWTTKRPRVE